LQKTSFRLVDNEKVERLLQILYYPDIISLPGILTMAGKIKKRAILARFV